MPEKTVIEHVLNDYSAVSLVDAVGDEGENSVHVLENYSIS